MTPDSVCAGDVSTSKVTKHCRVKSLRSLGVAPRSESRPRKCVVLNSIFVQARAIPPESVEFSGMIEPSEPKTGSGGIDSHLTAVLTALSLSGHFDVDIINDSVC